MIHPTNRYERRVLKERHEKTKFKGKVRQKETESDADDHAASLHEVDPGSAGILLAGPDGHQDT